MRPNQQAKLIAVLVLLLLVVVLVLQNTEPVETRLLFYSLTLPLAGLIASVLVIGYILGVLTALLAAREPSGKKGEDSNGAAAG